MNFSVFPFTRLRAVRAHARRLAPYGFGACLFAVAGAAAEWPVQTVRAQEAEQVVIEADGRVEWNRAENYYAAEENVRLTRGGWRLTATHAVAHYSAVRSDERPVRARDLERAEAFGAPGAPVVLRHLDGTRVSAPRMVWWPSDNLAETDGGKGVLERRDGSRLTASGRLSYHAPPSGAVTMRAVGSVTALSESGERLSADEIVARTGRDGGRIELYQAVGSVTLERPNGEIAKSERARYDVAGARIFLDGNVRLSRAGQVLEGERAEMDLRSGRSILLPAEGGQVEGRFERDAE